MMEIEIPDEPKVLDHDQCLRCNHGVRVILEPNGEEFSAVSVFCRNCNWTGAAYIPRITITG